MRRGPHIIRNEVRNSDRTATEEAVFGGVCCKKMTRKKSWLGSLGYVFRKSFRGMSTRVWIRDCPVARRASIVNREED